MKRHARWVQTLLWMHLFVCVSYLLWHVFRAPVWAGSITVFAVLTVQFTWSFTVGLIVGPSRQRRPALLACLLLAFMPLQFVGMMTWVIGNLLNWRAAITFLIAALGVFLVELGTGLWYGMECHILLKRGE